VTVGGNQDRPDLTRGTQSRPDLEDVLRRALHAAVDTIEPADDGLTRIMHRLTAPSAVRRAALLVTDCVDLGQLIAIWLEPAFTWAMRASWRHHAGYRPRNSRRAMWARLRRAVPWLRPALAVASAATIVVLGTVVLGQVRQIVTRISLNTGASTPVHAGGHSAGGGHAPSPTANHAQTGPTGPGNTPGQVGPTTRPHSCALMSCPPSASATPMPSPAVTPSGSPTAVPGQSPGPTPTPSKTNHGHHKPHPSPANPSPPGHKGHGGS
jgi:hypothetical protein